MEEERPGLKVKIVSKQPSQLSRISEEQLSQTKGTFEYSEFHQTIREGLKEGASAIAIAELLQISQQVLPDLIQIKALDQVPAADKTMQGFSEAPKQHEIGKDEGHYKKQFAQYERTVWDAIHIHQKEAREKLEKQKFELKRQKAASQHSQLKTSLSEQVHLQTLSVKEFRPASLEPPSNPKHALKAPIQQPRAKKQRKKNNISPERLRPQEEPIFQTVQINQDLSGLLQSTITQFNIKKSALRPPKAMSQSNLHAKTAQHSIQQTRRRSIQEQVQSQISIEPNQKVRDSSEGNKTPKCKFVIRSDKSETPLEQINDITENLQSKINKRAHDQKQRALMKFLQKKALTSKQAVTNDIKLINGKALGLERAIDVDKEIGLFQSDPDEPHSNHLTLLKEFLERDKPSVQLKQINNINIVQTLMMNEPAASGPLLSDLHALNLQKQKLASSVQKAITKLLAKEVQLEAVIKDPANSTSQPQWNSLKQFCDVCVGKIAAQSDKNPARVALGSLVVEEPSDTSVVLDTDRQEALTLIKDELARQSHQINDCYKEENNKTGSKLDPSETNHYRKYLFKSRNQKRINSEVIDPVFAKIHENAQMEKIKFNQCREMQLKALELLKSECLGQVRAWSASHSELLTSISEEIKQIFTGRMQESANQTEQMKSEMVAALSSVTYELSRLQLENKRKDKIIKEILALNDHVQRNNELAIKLYSKADSERASLSEQLDSLRFKVLHWLPNFVKYTDEEYLMRQVAAILPDTRDLNMLGGTNFWHAQKLQIDNDGEQAMWGLEREDLVDIEYRGEPVLQRYHISALWLRSDLCRLNKLLDIPTVMAVDLEQTKAALKKSEKRNKILGEEVKMLKTKIDSMEKRIETLSHQNFKTGKQLATVKEELRLANLQLARDRQDKQTQTDVSNVIPRKKPPGSMEKKAKSTVKPKLMSSPFARQTSASNSLFSLSPDRLKGLSKVTQERLVKRSVSSLSLTSGDSKEVSSPQKILDLIPEAKKMVKEFSRMKSTSLAKQLSAAIKQMPDTLTSESGLLVRRTLGVVNSQTIWSSEVRYPDSIWQQFKPRYIEMETVMTKLAEDESIGESALSLLWDQTISTGEARLKQAQDLYLLQKCDWRAALFINLANLEFHEDPDAIQQTKLKVSYNLKDCRATKMCARLLKDFGIDTKQAFAFEEQHQLMTEENIGSNPNLFTPPQQVYLHEAFYSIASHVCKKLLSKSLFEEFSGPLLAYIYAQLKQKCNAIVLARLRDNSKPDSIIEDTFSVRLDNQATTEELQLLDTIRGKLEVLQSNDFQYTLPIRTSEFFEVLQGAQFKIKMPQRFDEDDFEGFCKRYILEGSKMVDKNCIQILQHKVILYRLSYEDALLIGLKSIKVLESAIEIQLKPAYNLFAKAPKGGDQSRKMLSLDSVRKILMKVSDITTNKSPGKAKLSKFNKINDICNELDVAFGLKQIEGIDLGTFRRAFELLDVPLKSLSRLGIHPFSDLPINKTESLTQLQSFLKAAFLQNEDSSLATTTDHQINFEQLQCSQKLAELTEVIQMEDLRHILFGEKLIVVESETNSVSSDSDQAMPINLDLKTVQEQSLKLNPITIGSVNSPADELSLKVSDKPDSAALSEPGQQIFGFRWNRSSSNLDYLDELLDEEETEIIPSSKKKPKRNFKKYASLAVDQPKTMVDILEKDEIDQSPLLPKRHQMSEENNVSQDLPKIKVAKRHQHVKRVTKPAVVAQQLSPAKQGNAQDKESPLRITSLMNQTKTFYVLDSTHPPKTKFAVRTVLKKAKGRLLSVEAAKDNPSNIFIKGSRFTQETVKQEAVPSSAPAQAISGRDMNIQTGQSLYQSMTSIYPSKISTASNKKTIEAFIPQVD